LKRICIKLSYFGINEYIFVAKAEIFNKNRRGGHRQDALTGKMPVPQGHRGKREG